MTDDLRACATAPPEREPFRPAGRVLATLNEDGTRRWLEPTVSRGRFLTRRRALAIALIRNNRSPGLFPLRLLATVWVDVFRGVPTVLLVYLVGFGIPALELEGLPTDPVVLGGIALTLSYSGYVSEVYRAGINSVHKGQTDAALSVGLTKAQAMRHVILPQGIRRVGPPLLNDFVALQKDVALISIIGPQEAFRVAQIYQGENFNYTPIIAAALLYLLITVPLARLVDRMGGAEGVR